MKKLFLILSLLFIPVFVQAAPVGPAHRTTKAVTLINNQDLTASRTATVAIDLTKGFAVWVLYINHTNTAATALAMTCTGSHDNNVTKYVIQSCSVSSGVCTSDDASWSKTVSGNKNWPWRVNILGYRDAQCVFTDTAGGAADFITVKSALVTQ